MKRQVAAQVEHELDETRRSLPILDQIPALFTDRQMFRSVGRFRAEGFKIVEHHPAKMMCASHKRVNGYVFKKFSDSFPKDQLTNYMRRIEGARRLRKFIADHGFSQVVAPKKWLYKLPPAFPERYLVVADKLDLMDKEDTERRYDRIDETQMHELAVILYYFRGLNSTLSNLPYTEDRKIAFIDTERWDHDKDFLEKVGDRISSSRRKQAGAVYKELKRRGARPFSSLF